MAAVARATSSPPLRDEDQQRREPEVKVPATIRKNPGKRHEAA
jgi:hypothetical protein